MAGPLRRFRTAPGTADRGISPVELAILLPLVLVLLFASIQVAAIFLARAVALNAAQLAVTACRTLDGASEEEGRDQAVQFIADAGDWLTPGTITVEKGDTEVTAVVSGSALSLIPGWEFTVRQTAHGTRERFTED